MLNQKGFAPVIIIIAIALVAVAGFAGFRILGSEDNDGISSTSESETNPSTSDATATGAGGTKNSDDSKNSGEEASDESSSATSDGTTGTSGTDGTPGTSTNPSTGGSDVGSSGGEETPPQTKSFNIDSFSFGYSSNTLNVSPGDVVTINLTNSGGKHDWVIDEISGAATEIINGGQTDSITFTVPQSAAGKTYKFYCSVGNHRALGMEGNFIVSQ